MKPVDQDVFGSPDGNCFTACLASLLGVGIDDLRDIEGIYREGSRRFYAGSEEDWPRAWRGIQRIVARRFSLILATLTPEAKPAGYALMAGKSPRGEFGHYVVALDGEIAHDPHFSRDGLAGPAEEYVVLLPAARRRSATEDSQ